jgi:hypothetical protein
MVEGSSASLAEVVDGKIPVCGKNVLKKSLVKEVSNGSWSSPCKLITRKKPALCSGEKQSTDMWR